MWILEPGCQSQFVSPIFNTKVYNTKKKRIERPDTSILFPLSSSSSSARSIDIVERGESKKEQTRTDNIFSPSRGDGRAKRVRRSKRERERESNSRGDADDTKRLFGARGNEEIHKARTNNNVPRSENLRETTPRDEQRRSDDNG